MSSALRSPVLWILLGCVLVILGITLLFDAQEPDTDWRRQRWSGSDPATEEPVEGADETPEPEAAVVPAPPLGASVGVDPMAARSDLAVLRTFLKSRSTSNEDIIAFLRAVAVAHGNFTPIPETEPGTSTYPPSNTAKRYVAEQADFDREAEKAFLKALRLVRLQQPGRERNLRADVNEEAARVFAKLAPRIHEDVRERISKYLMRTIEHWAKAKYHVEFRVLEAAFVALAEMRRPQALEWMADEFIHTKNSENEILRLVAAHRAMVRFPNARTPGKLRYAIVKELVKTYSGTETQARLGGGANAARDFWSRVEPGVLAALQHFAGPTARDEHGEPLRLVNDFESWFREHKNRRKPPWTTR